MRISDKMGYEQVKTNLSKNRSEMADLQGQAASQKRISKPSDDPLGATRILQTRTEIAGSQQFLKSINHARTFLGYSEQSLGDLTEVLVRAKELAIAQANDASTNPNARAATAEEIDQLFHQAVQVGNRKLADRFLFGGFKTTQPPFAADGTYHGDNGEIKISIQKEGAVAMNMPGGRIFLGRDVKAPARTGPGPAQTFIDSSQKNPAIVPEGRTPASLPGERAARQVAEPPNPIIEADAKDTGLTSSLGDKGVNVFHVLNALSTSLRVDDKQGIQESLDGLDSALDQVVQCRAQLGAKMSSLTIAQDAHQKEQIDTKTLASSLEDADTIELVSDINKTEATLKAALSTSGKLIQPSLLDFLR